jgi:hypothetical protein
MAADMAYAPPMKAGKAGFEAGMMDPQHRIRITLSSKSVKNLEKGTLADVFSFVHAALGWDQRTDFVLVVAALRFEQSAGIW